MLYQVSNALFASFHLFIVSLSKTERKQKKIEAIVLLSRLVCDKQK